MEIITLSFSQKANHLTTHLYNCQESHIPYSQNALTNHNNNIFLIQDRLNKTTNYSPRAHLFDVRNSLGALNKHEYFESGDSSINPPKRPKNQYQTNLDNGIKNNYNLLNTSNTIFWSDYNKLIYKPLSISTLSNYQYPNNHKHFQNLQFSSFNQGQDEYTETPDLVDTFRYFLESCDRFQGINHIVDIDSAWAGYSNSFLTDISDEYFNDGNNSNLWTFGLLNNEKLSSVATVSRIKSIIELSKQSTLFFPINPNFSLATLQNFDQSSLWHQSAVQSTFINGVWDVLSQLNPTSMSTIQDNLTRGSNRNFVSDILIEANESASDLFGIIDVDLNDFRISDYKQKEPVSNSIYINGLPNSKSEIFSQNFIIPDDTVSVPTEEVVNTYKSNNIKEITKLDSFPSILKDLDYYLKFNVTSSYKDTLKEYRKIINNIRPHNNQLMELVGDKYELIEDISNIIENYTNGYDESDEDGDDLW